MSGKKSKYSELTLMTFILLIEYSVQDLSSLHHCNVTVSVVVESSLRWLVFKGSVVGKIYLATAVA